MKQILLILAVVALGCGKKETEQTAKPRAVAVPGEILDRHGVKFTEGRPVVLKGGHHVRLTLDLKIQEAARKALRDSGGKAGAAIVMDPNNGDLIAMVSMPMCVANDPEPEISPAKKQAQLNAQSNSFLQRCTQEHYPPGSIFTIVSGLAALEAGSNPTDFVYNPGYATVGRRRIDDTAPPGNYDFHEGFKHSSNTYFIHNALSGGQGIRPIIKMGQQFFLGQRTGLLPGQESAGQFPDLTRVRRGWSDGDTANLAIGQGPITVTPLQMALVTATIANGGTIYWPRLVARIESPDPNEAAKALHFPKGRVRGRLAVRPKNLKIIQQAMRADVADNGGTGRRARIDGYEVCGKTGTAEVMGPGKRDKVAWFVSYGPFQDPRYVVVVMIESGASGGNTCAPIAKKIYQALLER